MRFEFWLKDTAKLLLQKTAYMRHARGFENTCTCLTYHSVTKRKDPRESLLATYSLTVEEEQFEQQMDYLSKNYNVLDVFEVIEGLSKGTLPARSVLITFDDGYRDNLEVALPVLEKYKLPAVIFVAAGFIDGTAIPYWHELEDLLEGLPELEYKIDGIPVARQTFSRCQKKKVYDEINSLLMKSTPNEQKKVLASLRAISKVRPQNPRVMMNADELKKLSRSPLITIGCHSVTHAVLRSLSEEELTEEVAGAKARLENLLGRPVLHYSYPFGTEIQVDEREYEAARKAGFACAFTTKCGHICSWHKDCLYALPRLHMDCCDSLTGFKWKLFGFEAVRRGFDVSIKASQTA